MVVYKSTGKRTRSVSRSGSGKKKARAQTRLTGSAQGSAGQSAHALVPLAETPRHRAIEKKYYKLNPAQDKALANLSTRQKETRERAHRRKILSLIKKTGSNFSKIYSKIDPVLNTGKKAMVLGAMANPELIPLMAPAAGLIDGVERVKKAIDGVASKQRLAMTGKHALEAIKASREEKKRKHEPALLPPAVDVD